jgi:hypothetical protein
MSHGPWLVGLVRFDRNPGRHALFKSVVVSRVGVDRVCLGLDKLCLALFVFVDIGDRVSITAIAAAAAYKYLLTHHHHHITVYDIAKDG